MGRTLTGPTARKIPGVPEAGSTFPGWQSIEKTCPAAARMLYLTWMNITVIDYLEKIGQRREVDAELDELGLARKTLNDPINRQRLVTALEQRFPKWRKDMAEDQAP
ncbi:MAG: hypothetical protein WAT39_12685 [Planctomycetota bacterium]